MKTRFYAAIALLALNTLPAAAQMSSHQSINSIGAGISVGVPSQSFNGVGAGIVVSNNLQSQSISSASTIGTTNVQCIEGCMDATTARLLQIKQNFEALKKADEERANSPEVLAQKEIFRRFEERQRMSLYLAESAILIIMLLGGFAVWRVGRA